MRYRTALLVVVPIILLLVVSLVPAAVLAVPGKAASDNAAVHTLIYDSASGLTYNVIYHPQNLKWTETGATYPQNGPYKGE